MGLYNFQPRFVRFILRGKKQHTIRAKRKDSRVDVPGNICHCFTGLRTKAGATLLGRFPCTRVEEIRIIAGCDCRDPKCTEGTPRVSIAGEWLTTDEREKLARLDGFKDFAEMTAFWDGRLPFAGHIIHWEWSKGNCGFAVTHNLTENNDGTEHNDKNPNGNQRDRALQLRRVSRRPRRRQTTVPGDLRHPRHVQKAGTRRD